MLHRMCDMTNSKHLRAGWLLLLAIAFSLLPVSRAEAMYMESKEIERPIDWTVVSGSGRYGIAEEHLVRKWFFNEHDGKEELSVGTAFHFGNAAITVPIRLTVLVFVLVGLFVGAMAVVLLRVGYGRSVLWWKQGKIAS